MLTQRNDWEETWAWAWAWRLSATLLTCRAKKNTPKPRNSSAHLQKSPVCLHRKCDMCSFVYVFIDRKMKHIIPSIHTYIYVRTDEHWRQIEWHCFITVRQSILFGFIDGAFTRLWERGREKERERPVERKRGIEREEKMYVHQSLWIGAVFYGVIVRCKTLSHTTTHCITLQHIPTHCNVLQHTATY